ncbi:MAG: QueT transporter family protein [Planctomycetota bacterium]
MWRNTRMIVLTAITGGAYAALMIPFKVFPIIPGFSEVRPANVVPCLCSFLFGPAAAWGAGFGNLIGDLWGQLGPGSIFGFIGNVLLGYIPYRVWTAFSDREPLPRGARDWARLLFVLFFACATLATVIALGLQLIGRMPFPVIAITIFLNSFLVNLVLCPPLLLLVYPRVKKMGLLYSDIMEREDLPQPRRSRLVFALFFIVVTGGMAFGVAPELSRRLMGRSKPTTSETQPQPHPASR